MPNNTTLYTGDKRKCALCGNDHLESIEICDSDGYRCRSYFSGFLAGLYACRYCGMVYIGAERPTALPEPYCEPAQNGECEIQQPNRWLKTV